MVILAAKSLNEIPQYLVPPFFRWQHLRQKPKIGVIGPPGEGKSFSAAILATIDGMMQVDKDGNNEPCFSNMGIKSVWNISNRLAGYFGLKGGDATFETKTLNKMKLLHMDDEYQNGYFVLDEINMEFAEAMRSSSNVNLYFDRADQQWRKDKMGLIYTCIHEMWVDNRVRKLTDAYIKVEDIALSPEGLNKAMPQGEVFKWVVYPMTRLICGWTHDQTGRTLGPYFLHTKDFQGIFDTDQKQAKGSWKYAVDITKDDITKTTMEIQESPAVTRERAQWGWLYDKIQNLHNRNIEEIEDKELWNYLELDRRGISSITAGRQLMAMGVERFKSGEITTYFIDSFDLDRQVNRIEDKAGVLVS